MYTITVGGEECWDQIQQKFVTPKKCDIVLEHSLISIDKWEAIYEKPFLESVKSKDELITYIRCMTISKVPDEAYNLITSKHMIEIIEYMKKPMTASRIKSSGEAKNGQYITSELIYSWMITLGIPFEWEKKHINKLLTLIKICSSNGTNKKMSQREIMEQNRALNLARKAKFKH